jgi:hypothetical protein
MHGGQVHYGQTDSERLIEAYLFKLLGYKAFMAVKERRHY